MIAGDIFNIKQDNRNEQAGLCRLPEPHLIPGAASHDPFPSVGSTQRPKLIPLEGAILQNLDAELIGDASNHH